MADNTFPMCRSFFTGLPCYCAFACLVHKNAYWALCHQNKTLHQQSIRVRVGWAISSIAFLHQIWKKFASQLWQWPRLINLWLNLFKHTQTETLPDDSPVENCKTRQYKKPHSEGINIRRRVSRSKHIMLREV